jgi:hypothetical protein
MPSAARLTQSHPTNISSRAPLWRQGRCAETQCCHQVRQDSAGAQPECSAGSPLSSECNHFFRNTFEEPRGIAAQHATSYEAVQLRPAQGSRLATPSSYKEAPSNVAIHSGREGVKGRKKRCKQHLQGTTTTEMMGRRVAPT